MSPSIKTWPSSKISPHSYNMKENSIVAMDNVGDPDRYPRWGLMDRYRLLSQFLNFESTGRLLELSKKEVLFDHTLEYYSYC